jgi:hypothetical protein
MDALGLVEAGLMESWESREDRIPEHWVTKYRNFAERGSARTVVGQKTAPTDDAVSVGVRSALSAVPTHQAFLCRLSSMETLTTEILRGQLASTPRRKHAEFARLQRAGVTGDLSDVVYPSLVPHPIPEPTALSVLSGILGPDVPIVPAEDHPNVVVLLPCHTWEQAMIDHGRPDSRISDAVLVAVDSIESTEDIRVYGEPSTRTPFVVKCRCKQCPCLCELPWDWLAVGGDLDAPGLSNTLVPPQTSLLYSARFGPDAETKHRVEYLAATPSKLPWPGDLVAHADATTQHEDVLSATHMLASVGHGTGSLLEVAQRRQNTVASLGDSFQFTQTLISAPPSQSPVFAVGVNEARQALKGRVELSYFTHRVWGPDEADLPMLRELYPGRLFSGVVELYQASGTVFDVAVKGTTNTLAVSNELDKLRMASTSSPKRDVIQARLSRRKLHGTRPLHQAGQSVVSARSDGPVSARSCASSSTQSSRASQWADAFESRVPREPLTDPQSRFRPSSPVPMIQLELAAAGCCDVDTGVGWASYSAHDAAGKLMWSFTVEGRTPVVFDPMSIPYPESLVPVLRSLDSHEPFGGLLHQLCHALFPARTDAMWQYLRRLLPWDDMSDYLSTAAERSRLRVTLSVPLEDEFRVVDTTTDV